MEDEIKKALDGFLKARDEVDKKIHFGEIKPGEPIHYYTTAEFNALADAFENEKKAKKKYYTLFFQKHGWPKEDIDEWLNNGSSEV